MSSRFIDENNSQKDPDNANLWRMNPRRLEAEAVWDSVHAVAGTLNLKMSGRPVIPPLSKSELTALRIKPWWATPGDPAEANRRGVYILSRRNFSFPMFDKYDRPDSSTSCARRDVTTVAPQALWTLNNQISYQQAKQFAERLVRERGDNASAWVDAAWRIALARPPSSREKQEAIGLMEKLSQKTPAGSGDYLPEKLAKLGPARATVLTQLCLAIFNLNEFVYVD
jgi:hypothetical protein